MSSVKYSELMQANPPGDGTSAPQKDWPCLMDDGMGTRSLMHLPLKQDMMGLAFASQVSINTG